MASREIECFGECEEPHCGDLDCECPTFEIVMPLTAHKFETIWHEFGPDPDRHIAKGWLYTMEQPWRAFAEAFVSAEQELIDFGRINGQTV